VKKHKQALAFAMTLVAATIAQAQSLNTFGVGSVAMDVSNNGVVVGDLGNGHDFMWSAATGTVDIGGAATSGGLVGGRVLISGDGSRIAGSSMDAATGHYEASYYTPATGTWTALGGGSAATANGQSSTTWAMSTDGRYIAGALYTGSNTTNAAIFDTATGTTTNVGTGTTVQSRISGISDNGQVAAGYTGSSNYGVYWTASSGGAYTQNSIFVPGSSTSQEFQATAVSANGSFVAGAGFINTQAYVLNTTTGTNSLLAYYTPVPARPVFTPSFISNDGTVVLGSIAVNNGGVSTAVGFISIKGVMQPLDSFLASEGIDTANTLNFNSPYSMSADGKTIVGLAFQNSTGAPVGFEVTLPSAVPEPSSYAMLAAGLGVLGFVARRRKAK